MSRTCFVCDEIYPTRPGGAGSLIYNLAHELLTQEQEILLLLNLTKAEFEHFNHSDRMSLPNSEHCRAYHVAALCAGAPFREEDFLSRYDWESYCYDFACRQVYELEQPGLIEFVDYCGPAYYSLCAKIAGLGYRHSRIVVRIHGAIELIDRYAKTKPIDFDRYTIYALERSALRMADVVLYPTPSFLQKYYSDVIGSWMGETRLSPPLVKDLFAPVARTPNANIVLFYGRLYAIKGADLFVDAAAAYLNAHPNSALEFHLVGYDSMEPPVEGLRSYQEYLLTKIPTQFRNRFTFQGLVSPDRMAQILPRVKFAVFPSYFETFCLAAHELRRAGVPLIVSCIPAFSDYFKPGVDALFFDGSLGDLTRQIACLDSDDVMQKELSRQPAPTSNSALDFYELPPLVSIGEERDTRRVSKATSRLLVCVLAETAIDNLVSRTKASLKKTSSIQLQIVLLQKSIGEAASATEVWLLGDRYTLHNGDGQPITIQQARTQDALLIIRAGDEVDVDYLSLGLDAIRLDSRLAFVTCWKWVAGKRRRWLNTFLLAAMVELLPFGSSSPFTRSILRTPPDVTLIDLLDPRAGSMAEIAYLWKLTSDGGIGIQIPAAMLTQSAEAPKIKDGSLLSYLVLHDTSRIRQLQLTRYLAVLAHVNPASFMSLQTHWARKSSLVAAHDVNLKMSILVHLDWCTRWARKLERDGCFSRQLLAILRWLRAVLK